jgi:hypothetical protein
MREIRRLVQRCRREEPEAFADLWFLDKRYANDWWK